LLGVGVAARAHGVSRGAKWLRLSGLAAATFALALGGFLFLLRRSSAPDNEKSTAPEASSSSPQQAGAVTTAPAHGAENGAAGAKACRVNIGTSPPGALTFWDGEPMGKTPLVNARVPCGVATVVIEHPQYLRAEKLVAAVGGARVNVYEQLARPAAHVELSSDVPDTTFKIAGKVVGTGKVSTDVLAYTTIVVMATRPGYKPWWKSVVVGAQGATVSAKLEPLAPKRFRMPSGSKESASR
jgi:hypothetical protein